MSKYLNLIAIFLAMQSSLVCADEPAPARLTKPEARITRELTSTELDQASREDLSTAIGHYSRSRSLLLAALEEFDAGYKLANPKIVLDPSAWRNSVIDRAEELQRLLAPQPRISRRGMKYRGDSRLLNEARK